MTQNFDPVKLTNDIADLQAIVAQLVPLIPLVEPLKEMFAGKVAGEGGTQASGVIVSEAEFAASDPAANKVET